MFHRGNQAKARDLFDLCTVADLDPNAIEQAAPFFPGHGEAFIGRLRANVEYLEEEFAQIQRIRYERTLEECLTLAEIIIDSAIGRH